MAKERMTVWLAITQWCQHNESWKEGVPHRSLRHGNISWDDSVLYSYGVPIVRYFRVPYNFVLFVSTSYSITTSHHQYLAQTKCKWANKFTVPWLGTETRMGPEFDFHRANMEYLLAELEGDRRSSIRTYKSRYGWTSTADWVQRIAERHRKIAHYAHMTGQEQLMPDLDDLVYDVVYQRQTKWLAWSNPEAVYKREVAAAKKLARKAFNMEIKRKPKQ